MSLEQVLPPDHSLVFAKPGSMSEAKRQLKIKTGSVRRLAKEVVMYKKDEQTETDRVSRMKAAGGDASDIKHAEQVLAEAAMMVPDTRQRLETALADLHQCLSQSTKVQESEEYQQAKQTASEAEAVLA